MNLVAQVFLRTNKIVLISFRVLQRLEGIKCSVFSNLKFRRRLSNSGYLLAGCCFSRHSDEDSLLPDNEQRKSSLNINISNVETGDSRLLQSERQYKVEDYENMKRKPECSYEAVSIDVAVEENFFNTLEPQQKKTKIDETSSPEKSIQQNIARTVDVSPLASAESSKGRQQEKPKRERPNYFVAVQISNDQIHQALKNVQDHILEQEGQLKKSMIGIKTLHITLMVMHIGDLETHARALKALHNVHRENDDDMSKIPLQLEFRGLSHFQNRVLYAQLSTDVGYQRLNSLAQSVKKNFADASIFSTDVREKFTPHLTVAKIDFQKMRKGMKKIPPVLYKEFIDQHFGTQKVESIQLLSMTDPKNEAGYYSGDEIYFSAFNPTDRINALKSMLSIDEQKKDVKDMINKLMKEKLK